MLALTADSLRLHEPQVQLDLMELRRQLAVPQLHRCRHKRLELQLLGRERRVHCQQDRIVCFAGIEVLDQGVADADTGAGGVPAERGAKFGVKGCSQQILQRSGFVDYPSDPTSRIKPFRRLSWFSNPPKQVMYVRTPVKL